MSEESRKAIREQIGITQMEMAIRADVSLSTVQAYEAGRLENPQARILRKLVAAYSPEPVASTGSAITDAHPAPAADSVSKSAG